MGARELGSSLSILTESRKMKILYAHEDKNSGQVVIQFEPQARTIFRRYGSIRLNFPYVIHVINYRINSFGQYVYRGFYSSAFAVFFSNAPIKSLSDIVFVSPTERGAYVCTPHQYDDKAFESKEELIAFVSGLWWQMTHDVMCPHWSQFTPEEVLKQCWGLSADLRQYVDLRAKLVEDKDV